MLCCFVSPLLLPQGIISARNNGKGVFGVVPGMPVVAMKVLGSGGSGALDAVYKAYAEVLARLQRGDKIAAINLSLGADVGGDQNAISVECNWLSKIAAYGTAVAVAAGERAQYSALTRYTLGVLWIDSLQKVPLKLVRHPRMTSLILNYPLASCHGHGWQQKILGFQHNGLLCHTAPP